MALSIAMSKAPESLPKGFMEALENALSSAVVPYNVEQTAYGGYRVRLLSGWRIEKAGVYGGKFFLRVAGPGGTRYIAVGTLPPRPEARPVIQVASESKGFNASIPVDSGASVSIYFAGAVNTFTVKPHYNAVHVSFP